MLKKRLIPVLFIKNGLIVRSEDFSYHQNIGNIINEASRYNEWDIDELVYIDISKTNDYDLRRDDHKIQSFGNIEDIIQQISKVCFMPLAFGGKIRTLEDVDLRIRNGADKIILNTGAFENNLLITESAEKYGSQAVVISIDYKIVDNVPIVFTNHGQNNTNVKVGDWIKKVEELGAGEIFVNSIDRDGKAKGFDIDNIGNFANLTKLPLVACGGAGDMYDFVDLATETNVSGIAAGNMFHFTERSYPRAKQLMKKNGVNVR